MVELGKQSLVVSNSFGLFPHVQVEMGLVRKNIVATGGQERDGIRSCKRFRQGHLQWVQISIVLA